MVMYGDPENAKVNEKEERKSLFACSRWGRGLVLCVLSYMTRMPHTRRESCPQITPPMQPHFSLASCSI